MQATSRELGLRCGMAVHQDQIPLAPDHRLPVAEVRPLPICVEQYIVQHHRVFARERWLIVVANDDRSVEPSFDLFVRPDMRVVPERAAVLEHELVGELLARLDRGLEPLSRRPSLRARASRASEWWSLQVASSGNGLVACRRRAPRSSDRVACHCRSKG